MLRAACLKKAAQLRNKCVITGMIGGGANNCGRVSMDKNPNYCNSKKAHLNTKLSEHQAGCDNRLHQPP